MAATLEATDVLNGGEFLIRDSRPEDVFIPEELNEEQLMVKQMSIDFIKNEIDPVRARIEKQEPGLAPGLLKKMGDLGLLGAHMPSGGGGCSIFAKSRSSAFASSKRDVGGVARRAAFGKGLRGNDGAERAADGRAADGRRDGWTDGARSEG